VILGATLIVVPNVLLLVFGIAPATEAWIRVLGVVVLVLGTYYIVAARRDLLPFIRPTVWSRILNGLTPRWEGESLTLLWAVVGGVATPVVVGNAMKLLPIEDLRPVAFVPLLLLGGFLGFRLRGERQIALIAGLAAYLSLAAGVFANAIVEEIVFRRWASHNTWPSYVDHNLWPFEIIAWWRFAPIPMLLGAVLGVGLAFWRVPRRSLDS